MSSDFQCEEIDTALFNDEGFEKYHDNMTNTMNNLSDKLSEKGINRKYMIELVKAVLDYESYVSAFRSNWVSNHYAPNNTKGVL